MQPNPTVKILPEQLANRIAAGEVVERPASVVKELVENSLDAGATSVSIAINRGGKDHISIADNGHGMSEENLLQALKRFGTSKITSNEDLEAINTFGFRGEAIPAICSVARVVIRTREWGTSSGTEVTVEAGEVTGKISGPFETGTRIDIFSLFHNVPARKKFLKSDNSETSAIRSVVTDFALSNPAIHFALQIDGKQISLGRKTNTLVEKAIELGLGGASYFQIEAFKPTGSGELKLDGIASQPTASASSAAKLRLFVNKRAVRDRVLLGAVKQAYGNYLRPGEFPQGVLSLTIPAGDVDVNVHPQKTEVKFRRPELVFHFVSSTLKEGLGERANTDISRFYNCPASNQSAEAQSRFSFAPGGLSTLTVNESPSSAFYSTLSANQSSPYSAHSSASTTDGSPIKRATADELRFVAQIFRCYLLFEAGDDLLLLDMHAAHERVFFYRLACQLEEGGVAAQLLLVPEIIEIQPELLDKLLRDSDTLAKFGLEIDAAGEDKLLIRSIPGLLGGSSPAEIVDELANALELEQLAEGRLSELLKSVLTRVACHYSIRSGRELEKEEAYALIESLRTADSSGLCPHGRPVMRYLSRYELERMFGRVSF